MRARHLLLLMSATCLAIPGAAQADDHVRPELTAAQEAAWLDALVEQSPHRRALQRAKQTYGDVPHADLQANGGADWQPGAINHAPPAKAWPKKKGPRNYGFLPYWTASNAKLHWEELTEVAWFSAEVSSAGTIGKTHGWGGSSAKALIKEAHKHDVQVTLTFTLFSKSGISNVLATAAKRKALIDKIVALVIAGGADGVNIDFEGLQKASRDAMKAFAIDLTKAMHSKLPGSDVTLATPCVDWSGAWDFDYLAEGTDGLFVMAYAIHYKGGNPGPQLPMGAAAPWQHKTLQWVVDDYFKWGKAANKKRFIIGLPLYGNSWPSKTSLPGASKVANGKAVTYENAQVEAPKKGGWKWDTGSKSSYYVYKSSGQWRQTWVDDPKAFKLRVDYLDKRGVNMGLWALGYADKNPEVWKEIGGFMGSSGGSSSGGSSGGADAGGSSGGQDAGSTDAGGSSGGADAGGTPDSGSQDAGKLDAGTPDAGQPDAGQPDAGKPDAGEPDAGTPDAGKPDAGTPDTGTPDTGTDTAQPGTDTAQPDTGTVADTGTDTGATTDLGGLGGDGVFADTGPALTNTLAPKTGAAGGCQAFAPGGGPVSLLMLICGMLMSIAVSRRR